MMDISDTGLSKNMWFLIRTLSLKMDHNVVQTHTYDLVHRGGKEELYTVKLLLVYIHNKPTVLHLKSSSICSRITSAGFILLQACSWRECEIMFYYATAYSCTATRTKPEIRKMCREWKQSYMKVFKKKKVVGVIVSRFEEFKNGQITVITYQALNLYKPIWLQFLLWTVVKFIVKEFRCFLGIVKPI